MLLCMTDSGRMLMSMHSNKEDAVRRERPAVDLTFLLQALTRSKLYLGGTEYAALHKHVL